MASVFTYGSLMFPDVWQRVVLGDYQSSIGTIHGFRRVGVKGGEYPALIIWKDAPRLAGRVYFDVSDADIARLDHFETTRYARVSVAVTVNESATVADAYLALNHSELTDQDWDPNAFERNGLERFLKTYVAQHAP